MTTDIYNAATFGDIDTVREILKSHPKAAGETDKFGFTPLHGLAEEEYPEIAQFLIDQGANVNAANDQGITPLHLAAWPEMARLFLANGAHIEARTPDGSTPLLILSAEPDREEVIEVLLESGADVNATDKRGHTALDIALARQEESKVDLLKRYGAKPGKSM